MKKFFSAILLMTMMVFSVGTFVSCNDLVEEVETIKGQTSDIESAIAGLETEIAALETALQNAKSEAADAAAKAKAAADEAQKTGDAAAQAAKDAAAVAAAAQASADALETQLADAKAALQAALDGKANKEDVEAVVKEIEALKTALAGKADATAVDALKKQVELIEATLKNYEALLNDLKLKDAELAEAISYNLEAITNLKGQLDAQDMKVEDLETAVAGLVADVKKLNDGLVAIYDILGAIANQIQTVVFVPEYDEDLVYAQRYTVGAAKTNYVVAATYEVRPAKLATSITSENLSFASVDVKTKAAAAPEYFPVQVISADANTGRIVVVAAINDKDGDKKNESDYDKLATGKLALSLNIASIDVTELLIADSQPVNVDMVSAEYVYVQNAGDVALPIGFPVKDGIAATQTKNYEMPWNTPVESSVKALFDNTINVLVGGRYLTVAEANALLGLNLSVATKVTTTYVGAEEKKVYPVKVNGTDINATATLVASADYPGDKAVGKKAESALAVTVTNAKETVATLAGTATYTVTNKKSDFSFASVNEAWKYTYGKSMTVKGRELAVAGYEKFTEGQNLGTFTATYGDKGQYSATTTVTALSSKAVKFTDVVLPFTPGKETTYTFKGQVVDGTTTYSVAFDVVLGAMPEDKTIDLGTFSILGDVAASKIVAVSPVTKALAEIKAYDSSITLEAAYNYFVESCAVAGVKGDGVTLNGKPAAAAELTVLTAVNEKNDKVRDEKSYVTVYPVVNYENTIVVVKTYNFCGVKYTFTATVNTTKPSISFAANEVFVANGVANVDGTVKLPVNKTATSVTTGTSTAYTLNAIDLRNYVKVTMPKDLAEAGYELRYTLVTPMKDKDGKTLYPAVPSVQQVYNVVDAARTGAGAQPLNWNVDLNELEYEIALVSASRGIDRNDDKKIDAADDIVFEKVNVKLQIPSLVTFAADKVVSAKYVNGVQTKANIAGAMTVVDKFGNSVYNPYAKNLGQFFSGYYATLDAKGNVTGAASNDDTFFNVYDMAVAAGKLADVKVYLNNTEIAQSQVKFSYNQTTGEIVLSEENANLTGDIKFEVPVTLTYMYDNYGKLAQKATAVVVFSQNAEAGNDTPDVDLPSPAGKQFTWYTEDWSMDRIMDVCVTDEGVIYFGIDYDKAMEGVEEEYLDPTFVGKIQGQEKYENVVITPATSTSGRITMTVERPDYVTGEMTVLNFLVLYSDYDGSYIKLYSPSTFNGEDASYNGIGLCEFDEHFNTLPITAKVADKVVEVVYQENGGIAM